MLDPLILKILKDHSQLINGGKFITFCWIPSHVGIRGNEDADIAAKAGLDVAITNMRFPVSDLLTCVKLLTNCVLKNGKNCGTSVHQINFTVCNRSLVVTWPLRLSPYQPSSNWSYKTYKLLSPKEIESTGM